MHKAAALTSGQRCKHQFKSFSHPKIHHRHALFTNETFERIRFRKLPTNTEKKIEHQKFKINIYSQTERRTKLCLSRDSLKADCGDVNYRWDWGYYEESKWDDFKANKSSIKAFCMIIWIPVLSLIHTLYHKHVKQEIQLNYLRFKSVSKL